MQWFRLYAEFATDPVVQSLSFDDQRHFVMILCLKCSGTLDRKYDDKQMRIGMLRRALGLESVAFDEAKRRLQGAGLIGSDWQPKNWAKRQYLSDADPTASERKRRERERKRHATVTRDTTVSHGPQSQIQSTESEVRLPTSSPSTQRKSSSLSSSGAENGLQTRAETQRQQDLSAITSSLAQQKRVLR